MNAERDAPRRGRPRALEPADRAARILDAFETVVAENGIAGASMDAVARAAGMSKRTLYALFPGREALFDAWVARIGASLVRPLTERDSDAPLADRLRAMLSREIEDAASRRRLTVLRALIAEAPRLPEPARALRREAVETARARLSEEIGRAIARGEIRPVDPTAAAAMLLDMACPNPLERLLEPDQPPPTTAEARARLDLALAVFLRGLVP
jgi:AcrR family transcriptional regulator